MARQKLDTDIRQEQILLAALDLVCLRGMKGLNMAALARRVGVVPSAIYRHFPNKDAIVDGMLRLIERRLHGNVAAVRAQHPEPLAALEQLLMLHVRLIRENAGIPRVVFSEEVYGGDAARKGEVHGIIQGYLNEVAGLFMAAQDQGVVRNDMKPGELAVMFLGLVQPAAILWHLSDGGFDVTKQAERAWRVLRQALSPNGENNPNEQ